MSCQRCNHDRPTRTMVVAGKYYKAICNLCIGELQGDDVISGNAASYERRRNYEDNAQDTVQPWDANGKPRAEFLRLYPSAAKKMYSEDMINDLKRKM